MEIQQNGRLHIRRASIGILRLFSKQKTRIRAIKV
nr:MAG TPA: hypothetical protein [Caudoviricetes sp.]